MIRQFRAGVFAALVAITSFHGVAAAQAQAGDDQAPDGIVARFAVLGDAEPKPCALFPGVEAAVEDVNALAESGRIDFVVGVGDIAHKATEIQYENATPALQSLTRPFYPIMGNEEHNGTVEWYLEFASQWNPEVTAPSYLRDLDSFVMVHASPDFSRDFEDEGIDWMIEQIEAAAPRPVFLVVHAAQAGAYPEDPEKGVHNPRFQEVVDQPNLAAVISGDLHMDMDRTVHSRQIGDVHYLHMPALERTKIPDETRHTPMYRVFTVYESGEVQVDTYETGNLEPLDRHEYRFTLRQ
ncbi:MAG: Ser/Thr protein phosphatase family protein, calcineurin-like superfamily [Oceanicaulis sp. HLUCCA04]|nr:MAG: Ser/Thr protein phosphatase family protein, calcineurin-like superfamily [Oceanicaulis sp. HLUCCA04]